MTFALPYRLQTELTDAGSASIVSTRCARCNRSISIVWSGRHLPEHIAKKFRSMGWQFDLRHARKCRCPRCSDAKGEAGNDAASLIRFTPPPVPLFPEIVADIRAAAALGMNAEETAAEGGIALAAVARVLNQSTIA